MNNKSLTLCIGFFLLAGCGTVQVDVEFDSSPTPPGSGFATSAASFPTQTATSTVASPASAVSSPAASETPADPVALRATAVALGRSHTCVATSAGGVKCWGNNENRQLGNGSTVNSSVPVEVMGLEGVKSVAAGWAHSCALTHAGEVKCWGYNKNGELGNGGIVDSGTPVNVSGLSSGVVAIEAGDDHTCAVTDTGRVKCWGFNDYGQLGDGTKTSRNVPVEVQGLAGGVSAVAAGWGHTCVVTAENSVKCWGNNEYGQLGYGQEEDFRFTAVDVEGLIGSAVRITADGGQSCALTIYGGIRCWGNNKYGQLGDGTAEKRYSPVPVSGLPQGVLDAAAGWNHSCAITNGGGLKCWGWNYFGQLGDGTKASRTSPVTVYGLSAGVEKVGLGWAHTCVVTDLGAVKCWGSNEYGQLGDGTNLDSQIPLVVAGMGGSMVPSPTGTPAASKRSANFAIDVAAGINHTCALTGIGGVRCWGNNGSGKLGNGTSVDSLTPVDVIGLMQDISALTVGEGHTCAVTGRGGVKCWGFNWSGQLGDGTSTNRNVPVDVSGATTGFRDVTAGSFHTCAITVEGGVKCWGKNDFGQLGDGTTVSSNTPVDVVGLSNGVMELAAGDSHTCALTGIGGVRCWGNNWAGQLGDGTRSARNTPVNVIGLPNGVTSLTAALGTTCALMDTGGVKCWGSNEYGQLGDRTTTDRTTPVEMRGLSDGAVAIAAGGGHTCALIPSGGIKCWGINALGQLGDGTTQNRFEPVDVNGLTSGATAIKAGGGYSCALTGSGGIKCWGSNNGGQLGDGSRQDRYVPVDVIGFGDSTTPAEPTYTASSKPTVTKASTKTPLPTATKTSTKTSTPTATVSPGLFSPVSAGLNFTCALVESNRVFCWGAGESGQLGNGTKSDSSAPVEVIGLGDEPILSIEAGQSHACVITIWGKMICWGANDHGQLGDGTTTDSTVPVPVSAVREGVVTMGLGEDFTCVRVSGGGAKCWGGNAYGQLGNGKTADSLTPVNVKGLLSNVNFLSAGKYSACADTFPSGVYCWGDNQFGQLGDGTVEGRPTPVPVIGLDPNFDFMSVGMDHVCGRTGPGEVQCWGANHAGQLGDGTTTNRFSAVYVRKLVRIVAAQAGDAISCALTDLGEVKCWGAAGSGVLGSPPCEESDEYCSEPVLIKGFNGPVIALAVGNRHVCALRRAGRIVCWGSNAFGQLGDGTREDRSSPVEVSGFGSSTTPTGSPPRDMTYPTPTPTRTP